MPAFLEGLDEIVLPFRKNAGEDRKLFRTYCLRKLSRRTDGAVQPNRMSDDCRCHRSISRHHDRAHAEGVQFRDKRDRVCPRRVAERNQSDNPRASRHPCGHCQYSEALLLKLVNDRSSSRRRSREGHHRCERALDDPFSANLGVCHGCFRCLFGRVKGQKRGQLWQVRCGLV